jgi:Single-strand binding protein family
MSLNRTTIIGYLGQDPQLRFTPQAIPSVCTLSVATDESYTDKSTGERKEAWNGTASSSGASRAPTAARCWPKGASYTWKGACGPIPTIMTASGGL